MEDNPWTAARVAELRSLVGRGLPYTAIAQRLGISRNAAIGKAKRLMIGPGRDGTTQRRSAEANERGEAIAVSTLPALPSALDPAVPPRAFRCEEIPPAVSRDPLNIRMDQLRFFHCRYITNDDLREPTYCGRTIAEGTSWCDFHLARVTAPVRSEEIPLVPLPARIRQVQR